MFTVLPIVHIVPVPSSLSDQEFSFFQGFSREVVDSCVWIIEAIAKSPLSYLELFAKDDEFVRLRSSGCALRMQMAKESLLLRDAEHIGDYFSVIWSSSHTSRSAVLIAERMRWRPIHVSSDPDVDAIRPESLTPELFHRFMMATADALVDRSDVDAAVKTYIQRLRDGVPRYTLMRKLPFSVANHFSVDPAVMTLRSFGYVQKDDEELAPVGEDHVSYILGYARHVDELRDGVQFRVDLSMSDGLIFCPAMYAGLYKSSGKVWKDIGRQLTRSGRNFLVSGLVRNKGYSRITFDSDEADDIVGDPYLTVLLKERGMELWFLARVVGLASASQCVAPIRLPNSVMLHHDMLKSIGSLLSSSGANRKTKKLNRLFRQYSDVLRSDIDESMLESCFGARRRLLVAADFPIEWMVYDIAPLMVTHELSKISVTPGNSLVSQLLMIPCIPVVWEELFDILILSSFSEGDAVGNVLPRVLENFADGYAYRTLRVERKVVQSEKELIDALNVFSGYMVVLDCHGSHGGDKEEGWLKIGNDKVVTWNLANRCRVPPICVLSACSTHAVDGSHASVANGLLRCGAVSVLGTHAPIMAQHGAIFVARLLYRIGEYLPIVVKAREAPVSWREVVSGFFRMSYATDVLRGFERKLNLISEEQYKELHFRANMAINSGNPEWLDLLIEEVGKSVGRSVADVKMIMREEFAFVDTMLYTHLGRSEKLLIFRGDIGPFGPRYREMAERMEEWIKEGDGKTRGQNQGRQNQGQTTVSETPTGRRGEPAL